MTICQHLAITPDELAAIGFIHERMLGFPTGRANPPQGRARATPSAQPCVAHDRTPVGAVARGRIGCGQKLSQFTPVRCRLPGAGEARNSYSRSCADVAEYPSTQLESGLGLRPHEFESRILRRLTRENAPSARSREGRSRVLARVLASCRAALAAQTRTLTDGGERLRAIQGANVPRKTGPPVDKAGWVYALTSSNPVEESPPPPL